MILEQSVIYYGIRAGDRKFNVKITTHQAPSLREYKLKLDGDC